MKRNNNTNDTFVENSFNLLWIDRDRFVAPQQLIITDRDTLSLISGIFILTDDQLAGATLILDTNIDQNGFIPSTFIEVLQNRNCNYILNRQ